MSIGTRAEEDALYHAASIAPWQPIETAPKMKTILLFAVTDQAEDGTVKNWRMETGFYHEGWEGGGEYRNYSPWCWGGDHVAPWAHTPTHWMPLPKAPTDTPTT